MIRRFDLVAYSVLFLNMLHFVWLNRFLPLQDYPDWLFQGYVFAEAIKGQPLPDYQVSFIPVPNAISTLVIGIFSLFVQPEIAGKLSLTLYLLTFILGSIYLINSLIPSKHTVLSYFSFLMVLNAPFFTGNLSYCLSLGPLFYGMGYIIRRFSDPERANPMLMVVLSTTLYFSHAASYFVWVLFLTIFILFNFSKPFLIKCVVALLPSVLMLTIYVMNALLLGKMRTTTEPLISEVSNKLIGLASYLSPFHGFSPFLDGNEKLFSIIASLNIEFIMGFLLLCGYGLSVMAKHWKANRVLLVIVLALILGYVATPREFAKLVEPGERLIYPAAFLLLAATASGLQDGKLSRILRVVCVLFGIIQIIFIQSYTTSVSSQLDETYVQLKEVGLGDDFGIISESLFDYEGTFSQQTNNYFFLPDFPLARLTYYLNIEEHSPVPIFDTGIIVPRKTEQAIRSPSRIGDMIADGKPIVILGNDEGNRFIAGLFSEEFYPVLTNKYSVVLKPRNINDAEIGRNKD